ncbi:hypothetical protein PshuTeo2_22470 [Pseudomonas hunanensis]|nr:hypothetical protein [Pseudomonas hunanensis]
MFGSNDDKKAPAEAGEKKGLFSWFRKKPQPPAGAGVPANEPPAAEQSAAAPVEGSTAEVPQAPNPFRPLRLHSWLSRSRSPHPPGPGSRGPRP